MTQLILRDANKALTFGLPAQDTDTDAVLQQLTAQGWSRTEAQWHLAGAIQSGVYAVPSELPADRSADEQE